MNEVLDSKGDTSSSTKGPDTLPINAMMTRRVKISSPTLTVPEGGARARTSLRLQYEAEATVIKKQLGDLETIRGTLGLSQKRIAQILMVDPSAWTRWTRLNHRVPPHVYRTLELYFLAKEKLPGILQNYFEPRTIGSVREIEDRVISHSLKNVDSAIQARVDQSAAAHMQVQKDIENLQKTIDQLKSELKKEQIFRRRLLTFGILLGLIFVLAVAPVVFRALGFHFI